MLFFIIFQSFVAQAAGPDLRISFASAAGGDCEIELTRNVDPTKMSRYDVNRFVVPGLARADWIDDGERLRLERDHSGAVLLMPVGVHNYCNLGHGQLLDEFLIEAGTDRVLNRERETWSASDLEVARATQAFIKGQRPGRGLRLSLATAMQPECAIQGQSALLLLPDDTYPRGVVLCEGGSPPTWVPLMNLRWGDERSRSALLRPARVVEGDDHRGPSYLVVRPDRTPRFKRDLAAMCEIKDL